MFRFKQFAIRQENAAMKIGTDAVLLGVMAKHPNPIKILDVGCGTGIIGLMLAQRFPKSSITQIDLDEGAMTDTVYNQNKSPFAGRMSSIHANFLDEEFSSRFELIVCNPPFHLEDSRASENKRDQARHADHLPLSDFLNKSKTILSEHGIVYIILPENQLDNLSSNASISQLHIIELIKIKPKQEKATNRIIVALSQQSEPTKESTFILRNDDGSYTDSYKLLTRDFHLDSSKV